MKMPTKRELHSLYTVVCMGNYGTNQEIYNKYRDIEICINQSESNILQTRVPQVGEALLDVRKLVSIFNFSIICKQKQNNLNTEIKVFFALNPFNDEFSKLYDAINNNRGEIFAQINSFIKDKEFSELKSLIDHTSGIIQFAYDTLSKVERLPVLNHLNFIFYNFLPSAEYKNNDTIPTVVNLNNFSWLKNRSCKIQFLSSYGSPSLNPKEYHGRVIPVILDGNKNTEIEFHGYCISSFQGVMLPNNFSKGENYSCTVSFIHCNFISGLEINTGYNQYTLPDVFRSRYKLIILKFISCEFLSGSVKISGQGLSEIRKCKFHKPFIYNFTGTDGNAICHNVIIKQTHFFNQVEIIKTNFFEGLKIELCTFDDLLYFTECSFNCLMLEQNNIKKTLSLYNSCFTGLLFINNAHCEKLHLSLLRFGEIVINPNNQQKEINKDYVVSQYRYYHNIKNVLKELDYQYINSCRQAYQQLKKYYQADNDISNVQKMDYIEKKLYMYELSYKYFIPRNTVHQKIYWFKKLNLYMVKYINIFSWEWSLLVEKIFLKISQCLSEQYHNVARPITILVMLSILSGYYNDIIPLYSEVIKVINTYQFLSIRKIFYNYWNTTDFLVTLLPFLRAVFHTDSSLNTLNFFTALSTVASLYLWYSIFMYFKKWLP
ncbi:hypothetical protein HPDP_00405 [Candidatus Hepatincola sp. Pdp]